MITDLLLADLALASYDLPATIETPNVHALIKESDGVVLLALRGTADAIALLRDAEALHERDDPILGRTPDSFAADAEQILWRIFARFTGPWAGGAHSKGGSELLDLAAMMRVIGRPPVRIAAFEPAPVGPLAGLIDPAWTLITRHGDDEIPEAPPWRPHPSPVTALAWVGPRPLNPLDFHAMAGVRAAIAAKGM